MQEYTTYASNPTLRVQQSSPTPQPLSEQSMLAQRAFLGSGWNEAFPGAGYLNTLPKNLKGQSARAHKRVSSGSSITSAGPPSPLDHTINLRPHIATPDTHFSPAYDTYEYLPTPQSAYTSKSLPTPTSESFMYAGSNGYQSVDMRRIHSAGADENASYGQNSVSSMGHNSPATPNTHYEVDYSDSKVAYDQGQAFDLDTAMNKHSPFVAGFGGSTAAYHQSLHDVFADQNYGPTAMAYPQQQPQMPTRMNNQMAMMNERIQAAQRDHLRTASPITSNPRQKSPFRQDSPYAEPMRAPTQRPQPNVPQLHKTRTSVSPKELMLDEHDVDEHATPLFSNQSPTLFVNRRQPTHMANFYTPSFSNEPSVQIPQQYPFVSQASRQESGQSGLPDSTPDFPAHMASMESTAEEGPSEPSSQQSRTSQRPASQPVQRPSDTSSDGGTYSCTYHGCSLRFETPAKLQKHKREGHRQTSPVSTASPNLAVRNSQQGPHKCERINPSTGKPCNSIFSRPYDLTRHEDTIHNARKQKVRCHLCTEEKTFSRNDALTRHMRVVHPDVVWEGKTRKRHARD